jgi:predicted phage terminase large subunit-like protein
MVVDLAVSLKAAADNSAIGVGGYDKDNNFYCVDLFAQRVPPSRLINEIYRIADKWGLSVVYIEIGGFQEAFVHQLREEYSKPGRRPLSIVTYSSSGNKKERITHGLEPLITNRMFFTHHWIMAKTPLKEELDLHPSESATDDCLDVLEVIARVAQRSPRHIQSDRSKRTRHLIVNKKYGGQR